MGIYDNQKSGEKKTVSFVVLSALFHASAFAFVAFMSTQNFRDMNLGSNTTEIEIAPSLGQQTENPNVTAKPVEVKEIAHTEPKVEEVAPSQITKDDILVKSPRYKEIKKPVAKVVEKKKPTVAKKEVKKADTKKTKTTAVVPTHLPEKKIKTVEHQEPDVQNMESVVVAPVPKNTDVEDDQSEIQEPNQKQSTEIADAAPVEEAVPAPEMMPEPSEVAEDAPQNVAAIEETPAQEEPAAQAEEKPVAQAVAAAAAGVGSHNTAATRSSTDQSFGIPTGVRSIDQLRQRPGNKVPEYDRDDRFNRREGEVAFVAYVTRDGGLTNFKLLKSTGHKSLDLKTLKTLKTWKFQPGQEGWVELPFNWQLKGGPQAMPSSLRTSVSRN